MSYDQQDADVVAEEHVREMSQQLTMPRSQECLLCYLRRMVPQFNCDGTLRFSKRWSVAQPGSKRFARRRWERDGGFCDCEVIMNVFRAEIAELADADAPCRHVPRQASI